MSAELLKRCVLFKGFTQVGLDIFGKIARPKIILSGKPLFSEGAASESLFIVLDGRVQVMAKSSEGKDVAVGSLGPGEHLGELSLLGDQAPTHLCSAVAEVDSKLLELSKADFQELMKSKPQACIKLQLAIAQELAAKLAGCKDAMKSLVKLAAR